MSADERPPKRQRTSYSSPQSPGQESDSNSIKAPLTFSGVQFQDELVLNTPPPSVHMSPTWPAQALPPQTERNQVTFPTPPSTAGFHGQMAGRPGSEISALDSGQHTPVDSDRERRSPAGHAEVGGIDVVVNEGPGYSRTDHERHGTAQMLTHLPLYKLSTKPVQPLQIDQCADLIAVYNLKHVQASVARKDERGNKINKLRKSYEGKIRTLGIEGRPKAKKMDDAQLRGMVDPRWDTHQEDDDGTWWDLAHRDDLLVGKDGSAHSGVAEMMTNLDSAFSMAPGQVPNAEAWKKELGLDDVVSTFANSSTANQLTKTVTNHLFTKTASVQSSEPTSPKNTSGRPGRTGAKRRYDDASWEGYAESEETPESKRSKRNASGVNGNIHALSEERG